MMAGWDAMAMTRSCRTAIKTKARIAINTTTARTGNQWVGCGGRDEEPRNIYWDAGLLSSVYDDCVDSSF